MKSPAKTIPSQSEWEKSSEYREAVLLKVIRAIKNYGYSPWMTVELKKLGLSL